MVVEWCSSWFIVCSLFLFGCMKFVFILIVMMLGLRFGRWWLMLCVVWVMVMLSSVIMMLLWVMC